MKYSLSPVLETPALDHALDVQREVLQRFHESAAGILGGAAGDRPSDESSLTIERNLFSILFLAVMRSAGLPDGRLLFYGLINQCMRAWVTACDNILDDEFKSVIPFNPPEGGGRMRSVLTIMAADRILFDLLADQLLASTVTGEQASLLSHLTLRVLLPSALQEHEEELGSRVIRPPGDLLERVHVPKTGLLFEAPISVPAEFGEIDIPAANIARGGLRAFGLACQILDDIVDLDHDIRSSRHNYLVSLAVYSQMPPPHEPPTRDETDMASLDLDAAKLAACRKAFSLFSTARRHFGELDLTFSDEQWRALTGLIATQIRVPESLQQIIGGTT